LGGDSLSAFQSAIQLDAIRGRFVAPAFRRALWNHVNARLKASATVLKPELPHKIYGPGSPTV
jgi:hypothetical protein